MTAAPTPHNCERVRAQVSLLLDGELSQLERRMVEAHLSRCADCREFQLSVSEFTDELRRAPLELLTRPVALPVSRRVSFTAAQVGVAAVMLVALLGVVNRVGVEQLQREETAGSVAPAQLFQTAWQPERELADLANAPVTTDGGDHGLQTAI
jgi:anti-sigma factor RsiW